MQGSPEVIAFLNESLGAELTSINQYFAHSKICESWGWHRLAEKYKTESITEMHDAEKIMDRILMLDGMPELKNLGTVRLGKSVAEQLEFNLELEIEAVQRYRRGVELAFEHGDHATREMLEEFVVSEEEHIDWIETQQSIIGEIGIAKYLQTQIGD